MRFKRSALAATCAAVLVSGSLAFTAVSANSDKSPAPQEEGPTVLAVDPSDGTRVTTDALDNVEKKVGEAAVLADDSGKRLFSIEVEHITRTSNCPARVGSFTMKPDRKTFLVLDVVATMDQRITDEVDLAKDDVFMPLVAQAFSVMGTNGVIDREVASEASWGCYADDVLAPAMITPGQKVHGKIVLDVPYSSGTVVYDPNNNGGWSWPY